MHEVLQTCDDSIFASCSTPWAPPPNARSICLLIAKFYLWHKHNVVVVGRQAGEAWCRSVHYSSRPSVVGHKTRDGEQGKRV